MLIGVLCLQGAFIEHIGILGRLGAETVELRQKSDLEGRSFDGLIIPGGEYLGTMDIEARRNAYGRQLGSFACEAEFEGIGRIPMTFIRAPYIERVGKKAKVLSVVDGHIVAARQGNQLVTAFHPELTDDSRVHEYFLDMVKKRK